MATMPVRNKTGSRSSLGPDANDIPASYHETYLYAIVQDPHHLFAFWEIAPESAEKTGKSGRRKTGLSHSVLRLLEITDRTPEGSKEVALIPVAKGASSRYITVPEAGNRYRIEFGLTTRTGRFFPLCGSKVIDLPKTREPGVEMATVTHNEFRARTNELIEYSLRRGTAGGVPAIHDADGNSLPVEISAGEFADQRVSGSRHLFSTIETLTPHL